MAVTALQGMGGGSGPWAHSHPLGHHHHNLKPRSTKFLNGANPQADLKQQTTSEGQKMSLFPNDVGP